MCWGWTCDGLALKFPSRSSNINTTSWFMLWMLDLDLFKHWPGKPLRLPISTYSRTCPYRHFHNMDTSIFWTDSSLDPREKQNSYNLYNTAKQVCLFGVHIKGVWLYRQQWLQLNVHHVHNYVKFCTLISTVVVHLVSNPVI